MPTSIPVGGSQIVLEAEASSNKLAGGAVISACGSCSSGKKVTDISYSGTLLFDSFQVPKAGMYMITIAYLNPDTTTRQLAMSLNYATTTALTLPGTGSTQKVPTTTIQSMHQYPANNQQTFQVRHRG